MRRSEVGGSLSSGETVGSDRKQREADGCDHCRRHDRRNDLHPVLDKETQQSFDNTADDHSSHESSHTHCGSYEYGEREECEADTHNDRQSRTNLPDRIKLYESADTGDYHTVLDEGSLESGVDSHDSCEDDDRGDVAHEHREHVLETERNGLSYRNSSVQLINVGLCHRLSYF